MLGPGVDFQGACPKCNAALHCCKQCSYFEPSTRFQCLKPIPVRIAVKDQANQCELFKARVTVARDAAHGSSYGSGYGSGTGPAPHAAPVRDPASNGHRLPDPVVPRSASDARAAFDNLFRKSDS